MGSADITHHFISFIEKSKHVKINIASTIELLGEYVTSDSKSKEAYTKFHTSSILELNSLFDLVDTYLIAFQKLLVKKDDSVTNSDFSNNGPNNNGSIDNALNKQVVTCSTVERNDLTNSRTSRKGSTGLVNGDFDIRTENSHATSKDLVRNAVTKLDTKIHNKVQNKSTLNNQNYNKLEKPKIDDCKKVTTELNIYDLKNRNTKNQLSNDESSSDLYAVDSESYYSTASSGLSSISSSTHSLASGRITNIETKVLLKVDGTYKVSIKHVDDLNEFYVYVMCKETRDFYVKWEAMVKFYKKHAMEREYFLTETTSEANCDIFVAVLYESRWWRAKVLQRTANMLKLYFIDFGTRIETSIDLCRCLTSEFSFPAVLQKVGLNLEFTPKRQVMFNALVGDEDLYEIRCVKKVEDKFQVTIEEVPVDQYSFDIRELIDSLPANGEVEVCNREEKPSESEDAFEKALENFDPMKEDFFSEVNDYKIDPDNACQAVMGYIPNDGKTYCKFGKKCRKKRCPRLHQAQDPDGYTLDREQTATKTYEVAELPLNEIIKIQVTSVVNVGEFYAQVASKVEDDNVETYESLVEYMNRPENVQEMKKLHTLPTNGEILIAKFGGYFFRGKVLSYTDNDICHVFNVDVGTSHHIHLKDLRRMDPKYNHLPFQAFYFSVRRRLHFNITPQCEHYDVLFALFRYLFFFQHFQCVVESTESNLSDVVILPRGRFSSVDYFSKCCARILNDDDASSLASSKRTTELNYNDDVDFVPA